jgi:hypothetical protein
MTATKPACEIEVDAPDGASAVELEQRLWYLSPTTVAHGSSWIVEIPGPTGVDEVEAVVRSWLGDVGASATTLRVHGQRREVESRRSAMSPPRHFDFIG